MGWQRCESVGIACCATTTQSLKHCVGHGSCAQNPLFSCFSSRSCRPNCISSLLKELKFQKRGVFCNCSVAKMLVFALLSASLSAIVSEMHALKTTHGTRNTAWDSDFVSFHHDVTNNTRKSRLRTLPLLQVSPLPKYCVLQGFLASPGTGQPG